MQVAFYTLGCKVNQYETEILKEHFLNAGYTVVEPTENADIYVVNSCTVTGESDKKTRKILRAFKKRAPHATVALCGCMPQATPNEDLWPEADVITGAKNRAALLPMVEEALTKKIRVVQITAHEKGEQFEEMQLHATGGKTRAFVKIQDGCNRYCSYCIIPTARGPVRSKPLASLQMELETLAAKGYKEVVLVGINLTLYGTECGLRLVDAVKTAAAVEGLERVRLGSLEPELLTPADIAALAAVEKLCMQFHISLQSGAASTLKAMRRHYTPQEYREIVARLRALSPDTAITTDVIVGFPGETEADFQASLEFVKLVGFSKVHVFGYSARPGTLAAEMPAQVEAHIIAERVKRMAEATRTTEEAFYHSHVGKIHTVLFESKTEPAYAFGHTQNYIPVKVVCGEDLKNQIRPILLEKVENNVVYGRFI